MRSYGILLSYLTSLMPTFTIAINSHVAGLDICEAGHLEEVEISANDQSEVINLLVKS